MDQQLSEYSEAAARMFADDSITPDDQGNPLFRIGVDLLGEFAEAERLRRYIIRYDTIRLAHPELPYGQEIGRAHV